MLARPNKEWRSYAKGECMDTLTASLEDYLEAIWVTNLREKVVRVKDIAKFLNVKTASVVGAMKTLTQKRLVVHERYGYIQLTQQGVAVASEIYERHKTLYSFFHEILGVDAKTATEDACRIEHYINKMTAEKMVCAGGQWKCKEGAQMEIEPGMFMTCVKGEWATPDADYVPEGAEAGLPEGHVCNIGDREEIAPGMYMTCVNGQWEMPKEPEDY